MARLGQFTKEGRDFVKTRDGQRPLEYKGGWMDNIEIHLKEQNRRVRYGFYCLG